MKREFLFDIFRCSNTPEIFPLEWPKKVMFHLLANRIFRNIFVKDKQPWFQAMQIFYSLKTHWILITQHRKNPKQSGVVAGFEVCYADLILFGWSFSHQVRFRISPWVVCVNGRHSRVAWVRSPWGHTILLLRGGGGLCDLMYALYYFQPLHSPCILFLGVCTYVIRFFCQQHFAGFGVDRLKQEP